MLLIIPPWLSSSSKYQLDNLIQNYGAYCVLQHMHISPRDTLSAVLWHENHHLSIELSSAQGNGFSALNSQLSRVCLFIQLGLPGSCRRCTRVGELYSRSRRESDLYPSVVGARPSRPLGDPACSPNGLWWNMLRLSSASFTIKISRVHH